LYNANALQGLDISIVVKDLLENLKTNALYAKQPCLYEQIYPNIYGGMQNKNIKFNF